MDVLFISPVVPHECDQPVAVAEGIGGRGHATAPNCFNALFASSESLFGASSETAVNERQ
jgi:hypothetical protein